MPMNAVVEAFLENIFVKPVGRKGPCSETSDSRSLTLDLLKKEFDLIKLVIKQFLNSSAHLYIMLN